MKELAIQQCLCGRVPTVIETVQVGDCKLKRVVCECGRKTPPIDSTDREAICRFNQVFAIKCSPFQIY